MVKWISFAAIALFGSTAALANAEGAQDKASYSISYAPSELNSAAAVYSLHQRIRRIARENCPSYGVSRELKAGAQCRADVAADLVSRIGNPALSALHAGDEGRTVAAN